MHSWQPLPRDTSFPVRGSGSCACTQTVTSTGCNNLACQLVDGRYQEKNQINQQHNVRVTRGTVNEGALVPISIVLLSSRTMYTADRTPGVDTRRCCTLLL